ncbi:MAG: hypothetical protein V3573_03720 [Desulfovibrionaceae bacterium]
MSRTFAPATLLPADEWVELQLPWRQGFWEGLTPMTLMRLNPHWDVTAAPGPLFPVEDVLVEKKFTANPEMASAPGRWSVRFPSVGLDLAAEAREEGRGTALRWGFQPTEPLLLTTADARKTMEYWLPSLREYYRLYESNSLKHRFWRMFMNRVMLTMNPAQRRICSFIFKFTLLELVFIGAVLIAYFKFIA